VCSHKKAIVRLRVLDPGPSPLYEFYDLSYCRLSAKATPCMSTFDLKHAAIPEFNRPARLIQATESRDSVVFPLRRTVRRYWLIEDVGSCKASSGC